MEIRKSIFFVVEYARSESSKSIQPVFERTYAKNESIALQILIWYIMFKDEGCLCRAK